MRRVYGDKYLQDQQYMFGVKNLLMADKVLLKMKNLPCCFDDQCNDRSGRFPHAVKLAC